MGGHDEKVKNFGKSKKKIGDLYELDNFKQKIFFEKKISKLRKQMSFFERFLTKVNFFLIDRANRTRFSETGSLSDREKWPFKDSWRMSRTQNFKLVPIRKQFRIS